MGWFFPFVVPSFGAYARFKPPVTHSLLNHMNAKIICFIFDIGKNNKIHESKLAQFKALIADFKDFTTDQVIASHIRMKRKHPDNSPLYYIKAVRHELLQKNHEAWKKEDCTLIRNILGARC